VTSNPSLMASKAPATPGKRAVFATISLADNRFAALPITCSREAPLSAVFSAGACIATAGFGSGTTGDGRNGALAATGTIGVTGAIFGKGAAGVGAPVAGAPPAERARS